MKENFPLVLANYDFPEVLAVLAFDENRQIAPLLVNPLNVSEPMSTDGTLQLVRSIVAIYYPSQPMRAR